MPSAARMSDKVLQSAPHCHAPIHPPAPVPTPLPHPPMPVTIVGKCVPTVMIGSLPAAVMSSMTSPCMLPGCVPAGPGIIAQGSATVMIGNLPAARMGDMVAFATCVAPIPAPVGKILPPCASNVDIGG